MLYNKEKNAETRRFISENKNLIAIIIIIIGVIIIVPALGSYATGKTAFPQDWMGWVLYMTCSIITAVASVCIYLSLHDQGKLNVRDNSEYIEANKLHKENCIAENKKVKAPINPEVWEVKTKRKKLVFQFFSIFLGMLGLGAAILTYNWTQLLSCILSMIMSLTMGLIHMADVEKMWTEGYLEYETYIKLRREEEAKKEQLENKFLEAKNEDININSSNISVSNGCSIQYGSFTEGLGNIEEER